jgi:hypothetical protein
MGILSPLYVPTVMNTHRSCHFCNASAIGEADCPPEAVREEYEEATTLIGSNGRKEDVDSSECSRTEPYYQVLVRLDNTRSHLLHFSHSFSSDDILQDLSLATRIPAHLLYLHTPLPLDTPPHLLFLSAFTKIPIQGGKGGFGTLLKGQSKQAAAKTTVDFGACRDLSGRRLRHVNDEILLRKWKIYQEQLRQLSQISSSVQGDSDDDGGDSKRKRLEIEIERIRTESGLHNWNLMVPNWSEISGSGGTAHPSFQKKQERIIKRELEEYWRDIHKKQEEQQYEKQKRHEALQSYLNPLSENQEDKMKRAIRAGLKKKCGKSIKEENTDLDHWNEEEEDVETPQKKPKMEQNDEWNNYVTVLSGDVVLDMNCTMQSLGSMKPSAETIDPNSIDTAKQNSDVTLGSMVYLQSKANFSTVCSMLPSTHIMPWMHSISTFHGSYFEVKIVSEGVAQIGWADVIGVQEESQETPSKFRPSSDSGDGVGDDKYSYGYDGGRGLIFHNGEEQEYGEILDDQHVNQSRRLWKQGDVVGCMLNAMGEIKFSINGIDQGLAFQAPSSTLLCPAISLNQDVIIGLRMGEPFEYPPGNNSHKD